MRRAVAAIFCGLCLLLLVACGQTTGGTGNAQASDLPTALHVTLPPSRYASPLYHPIDNTITDAVAVQRLYAAALDQPAALRTSTYMCPNEILGDPTYHLVFLNGSHVLRTADLEATGCQWLRFGPHDVRAPDLTFLTLFQQTLAL
jgi:hypothetical protein